MKELAEKLRECEITIAKEKGPLDLFALFLREDAPDKWDLLIAAEWIEKNKEESLKYITGIIQKALSKENLLMLSRIVLIDEKNPALKAIHNSMHIEHSIADIQNSNFFGLQIKHAYLITSRRRNVGVSNNTINTKK
ncbi:MAG: hypothetical protein CVU62_03885 [Deltaproteobacteria bacterium HGW-Deltaproteobacteria-2]|jgi:hypothetical protein|nr:MAG: hypothetical protein CVU62_03885 [Deltaproteobacteria bacterium HGW-Deltaproteobacteria-2]